MAYTPKDMSGRIFDNKPDKTNDRQPDYTGTAVINGQLLRVAGWYNPPSQRVRSASISLRFDDKQDYDDRERQRTQDTARRQPGRSTNQEDFDDDIPF